MTVCFSVRQHAGSQHRPGFHDTEYITKDEDASMYYLLEASLLNQNSDSSLPKISQPNLAIDIAIEISAIDSFKAPPHEWIKASYISVHGDPSICESRIF